MKRPVLKRYHAGIAFTAVGAQLAALLIVIALLATMGGSPQ